jgi:uncharacterized repeat protein (TIGR01451 family)/CSLREA domain-containing protein/uncharacterized repeat protein (TIGR02543 family)
MASLTGWLRHAVFAAVLLLASLMSHLSQAATYTVDTTSDDAGLASCLGGIPNDCSLRGAMTIAVAIGGTATIVFNSSAFNTDKTITLINGALPTITSDLTITGSSTVTIAIDGNSASRIFSVNTGASFTLSDLTITNGKSNNGAGLYIVGGDVTLVNDTFSGNAANSGGAICACGSGQLSISGSVFDSNTAANYGGAIEATAGTITVSDTLFIGNSITPGSGVGGAMNNLNADVTITNSTFINNTVIEAGGALANYKTMTVTGSTFSGNTASASDSSGGAIYIQATRTTLSDCTFDGNSAENGGGIQNDAGVLTVSGSTFHDNSASNVGGGILVASGTGAVNVINSSFDHNSANGGTNAGGGLRMNNQSGLKVTITNSTFSDNTGSGVAAANGTLKLNNNILANTSTGADCYAGSNTSISIQSNLIEDASCGITNGLDGNLTGDPMLGSLADNGGLTQTMALQDGSPAINAGDNTLAVDESSAALNFDQRGTGYNRIVGGFVDMGAYEAQTYTYDFVVDTVSDADLEGCSTTAIDCSLRGAINLANSLGGSHTITFDSSVFNSDKTITLTNGALPNITSDLTITGSSTVAISIDGNAANRIFYADTGTTVTLNNLTMTHGSATFGGAIRNKGTFTLNSCSLTANSAGTSGGGIYNTGSLTATDSIFSGNSAGTSGGAIYNTDTLDLSRSTFSESSALYGGAIADFGGTTTVSASTFSSNTASSGTYGGGSFYIQESSTVLAVINSTFSGDSSSGNGGSIYIYSGALLVSSTTFSGGSSSNGGAIYTQIGAMTAIANSTFASNSASSKGGGIFNYQGDLLVTNSAFAGNGASSGGNLRLTNGSARLYNSIFADSTNGGDCEANSSALAGLEVQNSLIEDGSCGITGGVDGNLTGDPMLGALADNGGPTQTMLPQAGSPVIDAGDDALAVEGNGDPLVADQRGNGYDRIAGTHVDMGALEVRQTQLSLMVGANGSVGAAGDASLIGANIDACSDATCTASYDIEGSAATISLTAAPDAGYQFVGWTGHCAADGTSLTATVTMDSARSCGATFAVTSYTIGGTVSGLTGAGLILQNNGGDSLLIGTNGGFTFSTPLAYNSTYAVTVSSQPIGQTCTVSHGTGTLGAANVTNVAVDCTPIAAILSLINSDGLSYVQYGQMLNYTVTLTNTGATAATGVTISGALSAALDATSAQWTCANATNGATCTASGSGGFSDTANLPGFSSVAYVVSVPVLADAAASTATFGVIATGTSQVDDTDLLVIFRNEFDPAASASRPQAEIIGTAKAEAILQGSTSAIVIVPPIADDGIDTLQELHGDAAEIRVQRLAMNGRSYARLLRHATGVQDDATPWSTADAGTLLGIGSVADLHGNRIVLMEGAAQPLALPEPAQQAGPLP